MLPDFLQFLAFYLLTVAFLKILSSWLLSSNHPAAANGVGWFVPGLA